MLFDHEVKYYLVLYVDNILWIHYLSFKVMIRFHAVDLWHEELQTEHILILATVSRIV